MDYARRGRIKIWGTARVTQDPAVITQLMPDGYSATPEAALLFDIEAWDINCPQHIPQKFDADLVAATLAERDAEIVRLKSEITLLKGTSE